MSHKDKNIKQPPRFCKYIHCKKLLPKDAPTLKKYCKDTDCAYKMNQLEAAERRAKQKIQNPKPKKIRICNFDECAKEFEVDPKAPLKAYCNDECRDANRKKVQAKRWEQEQIKIVAKREEKAQATIAETGTKSGLPKRLLERGPITSGNTAWAGNVNA